MNADKNLKSVLWDQLKAELWRESQGRYVGLGWKTTPEADQARELLDRMTMMETFAEAVVAPVGVPA